MIPSETFLDGRVTLFCGDSRQALDEIPDSSIDACVCDPPYALVSIGKRFGKAGAAPASGNDAYARASAGFMGQSWDTGEVAFSAAFWRKVFRVLKPGGHVVAFGGTRAYHRLAVAIEDAGFEIRDSIAEAMSLDPMVRAFVSSLDEAQLDAFMRLADLIGFEGLLAWVYGTGFPKSHDVAKAIDARALTGRARTEDIRRIAMGDEYKPSGRGRVKYDHGSGSAMNGEQGARLSVTDAAREWQGWGTALKPAWEPIVLARKPLTGTVAENVLALSTGALNIDGCRVGDGEPRTYVGRHPANVIHDGAPEVAASFPDSGGQQGVVTGNEPSSPFANVYGDMPARAGRAEPRGDSGSAARFFYSAKADADDRLGSKHPTVKPVDLMQWLVRLVTAPGGTVLDPFAGTGTTGEAAWREGFRAVLIEREVRFQEDIRRRMSLADKPTKRAAVAKTKNQIDDLGPLFGGAAAE